MYRVSGVNFSVKSFERFAVGQQLLNVHSSYSLFKINARALFSVLCAFWIWFDVGLLIHLHQIDFESQ